MKQNNPNCILFPNCQQCHEAKQSQLHVFPELTSSVIGLYYIYGPLMYVYMGADICYGGIYCWCFETTFKYF